jgi:hypothetical protein
MNVMALVKFTTALKNISSKIDSVVLGWKCFHNALNIDISVNKKFETFNYCLYIFLNDKVSTNSQTAINMPE